MDWFFQYLSAGPIPVAIFLVVLVIVLTYLVAFFQGRAVSYWPPRIAGKPAVIPEGGQSSLNVMDAIRTRKSVRRYLDKPVEEAKLNRVLEAGRLAPSSSNRQEWRFVVVRDPETRKALAEIAGRQAFVGEAPLIMVACADSDGHVMSCGQTSYPIDVAIALDHMTLAAVEQGLGTCWIGNFDENKVKSLLSIPERIRVVQLMPLGYPVNASAVEKKRLPLEQIVKFDHW
jgi:nitroreductase